MFQNWIYFKFWIWNELRYELAVHFFRQKYRRSRFFFNLAMSNSFMANIYDWTFMKKCLRQNIIKKMNFKMAFLGIQGLLVMKVTRSFIVYFFRCVSYTNAIAEKRKRSLLILKILKTRRHVYCKNIQILRKYKGVSFPKESLLCKKVE